MVGETRIGMVFKHTNPPFSEGRDYYTANLIGCMITDLQNSHGNIISYTLLEAQDAVERAHEYKLPG
jgi:ribosomal 30S subunit maturation factor RimM